MRMAGKFLVLIGVFLALVYPLKAYAIPVVSIEPAFQQVQPESPLDVYLCISNVNSLAGYQFDLFFDPAILQATSVIKGPFLGDLEDTWFEPGVINNLDGSITWAMENINPINGDGITSVSGSGTLAIISFNSIASGTSPLNLFNVELAEPIDLGYVPIAHELLNGSVTVSGVPEPSTVILLCIGLIGLVGFRRKLKKV